MRKTTTQYMCDRCKKELDWQDLYHIRIFISENTKGLYDDSDVEVCKECFLESGVVRFKEEIKFSTWDEEEYRRLKNKYEYQRTKKEYPSLMKLLSNVFKGNQHD